MSAATELTKALRIAFKLAMPLIVSEGTVTSVNKEARTCEVDRDDLPDLKKVRLNAILEPGNNTLTVFPKQGSKVLCLMIGNDPTDAYVISATEIEEIAGKIGTSEFSVNSDGFLIKREKTLKEIMDSIIDAMMAITVPTGTGPSGTPNNATTAMQPIKTDLNNLFR